MQKVFRLSGPYLHDHYWKRDERGQQSEDCNVVGPSLRCSRLEPARACVPAFILIWMSMGAETSLNTRTSVQHTLVVLRSKPVTWTQNAESLQTFGAVPA